MDTQEVHEELNELLNDDVQPELNEPETVEAVESEKVETGEPAEQVPESQENEPETPEEVPPTSPQEPDTQIQIQGMLSGLQAERQSRQQAEQRAADLQAQLAKQQEQPKVDIFEDPEGFEANIDNRITGELVSQKLQTSEMIMRTHVGEEKYEKAYAAFHDAALKDPSLIYGVQNSAHPAKFAYDKGEELLAAAQPAENTEVATLKAEVETLKAQLKDGATAETMANIPQTIANQGSAAPSANQLPDDDLASLLGET